MLLSEKIRLKFNEARKNNNQPEKDAYNAVIAKMLILEKDGRHSEGLDDDTVLGVVKKQMKEYEETKSYYKDTADSNCIDLTNKITALQMFLQDNAPKQMTEEEVMNIIIKQYEVNLHNKGKTIGAVVKEVGNRFDKSKVAILVNTYISQVGELIKL